jgi:hypothetical protein
LEPPAAAIWVNFFWVSFACHFWVSVRSLACKISCGDFGVFSEARIGFTLVLVLSNISLWDLFGLVFEFFVGKRKYTRFFSLASSCPLLDYKQRGTLSSAFGVQSFALSFRSKKTWKTSTLSASFVTQFISHHVAALPLFFCTTVSALKICRH